MMTLYEIIGLYIGNALTPVTADGFPSSILTHSGGLQSYVYLLHCRGSVKLWWSGHMSVTAHM